MEPGPIKKVVQRTERVGESVFLAFRIGSFLLTANSTIDQGIDSSNTTLNLLKYIQVERLGRSLPILAKGYFNYGRVPERR